MTTEGNELEQARAAAQAVLDRVKTDEAYAQRLRENPAQALLEAGMPPALLGAALQELGASEDEMQGYLGAALNAGPATTGSSLDLGLAAVSWRVALPQPFGVPIWRPRTTSSSGGEILRRLGPL